MNAENINRPLSGTILEIQRMSTEDGPGIRTTLFFKGCALRCSWCHNPESLKMEPELQWIGSRCIGCRGCAAVCPAGALSYAGHEVSIDRARCDCCGACAAACPSTALELLGSRWSVEALADEVMKDAAYYGANGGVTASGGEAALQAPFVAALFRELKGRGIHTALDTSGQCARESLAAILPYADLVLYDLKEIDTEKHREFTGSGNERVMENLAFCAEYVRGHILPSGLWIRTPVIPGATARKENIAGIGSRIARLAGDAAARWELCAFNNLCRDKYRRLGIDWKFGGARLLGRDVMEDLAAVARSSGVKPGIVTWTGATELTEQEREPTELLRPRSS